MPREITEQSVIKGNQTFQEIMTKRVTDSAEPKSFEQIFGDLSDCAFVGALNLGGINLNSLKGCPREIRGHVVFLSIDFNPELKSLNYMPKKFQEGFYLLIDSSLTKFLNYLPSESFENIDKIYCGGDYIMSNIDIVVNFSKLREVKGDFKVVSRAYTDEIVGRSDSINYEELERLNKLYLSVGKNPEKLKRLLFLMS